MQLKKKEINCGKIFIDTRLSELIDITFILDYSSFFIFDNN